MSRINTADMLRILFSQIKFRLIKLKYRKKFMYDRRQNFSIFASVKLGEDSELSFGEKVHAKSGVKIRVRSGAELSIGKSTSFNHGCIVTCKNKIKIGEHVSFGPNVLIYDHDHDYKSSNGLKDLKFLYGSVEIGNNCWIGANVIILRNTNIGDNCVVGAGAVIKGEFPSNSIIIQKHHTEIISYIRENINT